MDRRRRHESHRQVRPRRTLPVRLGGPGGQPGQFNGPHSITVDQDGNLYLAEVFNGRVQKFRPKTGADPAKLVDVIMDSGGRSTIADVKAPKILNRDWIADFRFALAHKDIELARSLASELHQTPPVTNATAKVFNEAKQAGNGELDLAALYRWYAEQK